MLNKSGMRSVVALLALAACGGDKKAAPAGDKGGTGTADAPAALAMPVLGVDAVDKMNYVYGKGAKDYAKVATAYKAKPRDWAAIKTAAEATLAKDAGHLDAHWALGEALANTGDSKKATAELTAALAGDWLRWGPNLASDPDLTAYLATADGKALVELSGRIKTAVTDAVARGPLLLGRRSTWKNPKVGVGSATTRGELYAYDVAGKRYLRLTHTDHTLAAVLPSPSGELLLAGFTEVDVPDPVKLPEAPPQLSKSWVSAWNPKDLTETAAKAKIGKGRYVLAGYGAGDQIVVQTTVASGRWVPGPATNYVVDRTTGKLTKSKNAEFVGPSLRLSLDEVIVESGPSLPSTVEAETASKLMAAVGLDKLGAPALASLALSPSGARVAYASKTDPCAKDDDAAKPSLYLGDVKTGTYKHVLTAPSRFDVRWLDDDHFIYEDGTGDLRMYDAAAGRETGKLDDRAGMALAALSPNPAPLCSTDPQEEEFEGGGEEEDYEGEGEESDDYSGVVDLGEPSADDDSIEGRRQGVDDPDREGN